MAVTVRASKDILNSNMLAMPIVSPKPSTAALTFCGPEKNGIIYRLNPSDNTKAPIFSAISSKQDPFLQISRIFPTGAQEQLGAAFNNPSTKEVKLLLRGQEIQISAEKSGLGSHYHSFTLPTSHNTVGGKFTWRSSSSGSGKEELLDGAGKKIASFASHKLGSKVPEIQVLVQTSGFMVEIIVMSGLAMNAKESLKGKGGSVEVAFQAMDVAMTIAGIGS